MEVSYNIVTINIVNLIIVATETQSFLINDNNFNFTHHSKYMKNLQFFSLVHKSTKQYV